LRLTTWASESEIAKMTPFQGVSAGQVREKSLVSLNIPAASEGPSGEEQNRGADIILPGYEEKD
jgi:hypothetical protein